MEAVAVHQPHGWNRLAPKTSCGTQKRTPTCRGLTDWISDEREAHGRVAASGMAKARERVTMRRKRLSRRHARARRGHPRLSCGPSARKTWTAMTPHELVQHDRNAL